MNVKRMLGAIVLVSWLGMPALLTGQTLTHVSDVAGDVSAVPATLQPCMRTFQFGGNTSEVSFSLFAGSYTSPLDGELVILVRDPDVPSPDALSVGMSVRKAVFIATEWNPSNNLLAEPMILYRDPARPSVGRYNPRTGRIAFRLYLTDGCGGPPVPMPLTLEGTLFNSGLDVAGDNGPVSDALMSVAISAQAVTPNREIRFSTEVGFPVADSTGAIGWVSDGDLLGERSCVVLTNRELTANLGIMPVVPDLGLDAATLTHYRPVMFSLEDSTWSETLGRIGDGDLLSITGTIVRTNAELIRPFGPTASTVDVGLDATHVVTGPLTNITAADCCDSWLLFSVERPFFSSTLNRWIGHGDLLSSCGRIFRTNWQLMAQFHPIAIPCLSDEDCPEFEACGVYEEPALADLVPCTSDTPDANCIDFGLDAVTVTPSEEIWFSVERGFWDANLGWISDGDVLSNRGYVVRRNLRLVDICEPLVDCANFGLDALDRWFAPVNASTPLDGAQ